MTVTLFPPVADELYIEMSHGHGMVITVEASSFINDNDIRVRIVVNLWGIYAIRSVVSLPRIRAVTNMC